MIKVADRECLTPDAGSDLQCFLDRYLNVKGMQFFIPEPRQQGLGVIARTNGADPVVLTLPNFKWPAPPLPRINTLYWPTGASRWSHLLVIADDATKDAIVEASHFSSAGNYKALAVDVELTTGELEELASTGFSIGREEQEEPDPEEEEEPEEPLPTTDVGAKIEMFLLSPHPVSVTEDDNENLWILPLVDERYLWQWSDVSNIGEHGLETWEALINDIGSSIRSGLISNTLEIDEAFDWKPDVDGTKTFDFANSALLLDAAAQSVGLRVVRQFDGSVELLAPDDGVINWNNSYKTARDDELETWARIAGEEFHESRSGTSRPEKVTVLFMSEDTTEEITATSLELTHFIEGYQHVIRVPYLPYAFDSTQRENLATLIAERYYKWTDNLGDITFAGIKGWKFGGMEDSLTIELCAFGRSGAPWHTQTRVTALPENFGISWILGSSTEDAGDGDGGGDDTTYTTGAECCAVTYADGPVELTFGEGESAETLKFAETYQIEFYGSSVTLVLPVTNVQVLWDEEDGFWSSDTIDLTCTVGEVEYTDEYIVKMVVNSPDAGGTVVTLEMTSGDAYGGASACCETSESGIKWTLHNPYEYDPLGGFKIVRSRTGFLGRECSIGPCLGCVTASSPIVELACAESLAYDPGEEDFVEESRPADAPIVHVYSGDEFPERYLVTGFRFPKITEGYTWNYGGLCPGYIECRQTVFEERIDWINEQIAGGFIIENTGGTEWSITNGKYFNTQAEPDVLLTGRNIWGTDKGYGDCSGQPCYNAADITAVGFSAVFRPCEAYVNSTDQDATLRGVLEISMGTPVYVSNYSVSTLRLARWYVYKSGDSGDLAQSSLVAVPQSDAPTIWDWSHANPAAYTTWYRTTEDMLSHFGNLRLQAIT